MKLKTFTVETSPRLRSGRGPALPKISIDRQGKLRLNRAACELCDLKLGDKISIAQDEEDEQNWYIYKDAGKGFELRSIDAERSLAFNHRVLCNKILGSLELSRNETHSFLIAGQPTEVGKTKYWGLLHKPKI